jgi:hypothetical protein
VVITHRLSFAVYCRHCGGGLEPMAWDQTGSAGVSRMHTRCPDCKRWWTYTTTITITRPHIAEAHRSGGGPMSMFPDEYPDNRQPKPSKPDCCSVLTTPAGVDQFTWRLAHMFGHTRTAVGVDGLAGLAGCSVPVAAQALKLAEASGWLQRIIPEHYHHNPPALWQGRLAQRR